MTPGDRIIASSANSPGSEGVANAIDGQPTKYLNFDTHLGGIPSGFVVTPARGITRVIGMALQSANDAPDRDPKKVTLEGSNDAQAGTFASGNWSLIARFDAIPAFADRLRTQSLFFKNPALYRHYRWTVLETAGPSTCCFQIAEVQLLGDEALGVRITSPTNSAVFQASHLPIVAEANSLQSSVAKVEFYADGAKLGEKATAPYVYDWQSVPLGVHNLTARVTDANGVQSTSTSVTVSVVGECPGLAAAYYLNTLDLSGVPTMVTQPNIDFDFHGNYTGPSASEFSVRWAGFLQPVISGKHVFTTDTDDGVRLWINNQLVVDNWTAHSETENTGEIVLNAGQRYPVRMEYFECCGGPAIARLSWAYPGFAQHIIPAGAFSRCQNAPITISPIANQECREDTATAPIAFRLSGGSVGPAGWNLAGASSSPDLVPHANLVFGEEGTNRTLRITPAKDGFGAATITLTATAEDGTVAHTAFVLNVKPVNDAPSFVVGNNLSVEGNGTPRTFAYWATRISAGPANESAQTLGFLLSADTPALFLVPPAVGGDGTLTFTSAANAVGSALVSVRLRDNGGTLDWGVDASPVQNFRITFTATQLPATLHGQITDALNGQPVAGATIMAGERAGVTDGQGNYVLANIPPGDLLADFDASTRSGGAPLTVPFSNLSLDSALTVIGTQTGYSPYTNSQTQLRAGENKRLDFSLSPTNVSGLRLVLNWGVHPLDLDAHLLTPLIAGTAYHIWYSKRYLNQTDSPPYAQLDTDKTSGFGPETITIARLMPGTYCYYVQNYKEEQGNSGELPESSAVLQIYGDRGLLRTLQVPSAGSGDFWEVCQIDGSTGKITWINRIRPDCPTPLTLTSGTPTGPTGPDVAPTNELRCRWSFGDGQESTDFSPLHTYTVPGTYTVRLDVTNAAGAHTSITKPDFITVGDGRPRLKITRLAGRVLLSWPNTEPGLVLESSENVSAKNWADYSPTPVTNGNSIAMSVDLKGTQFFRLRKTQ